MRGRCFELSVVRFGRLEECLCHVGTERGKRGVVKEPQPASRIEGVYEIVEAGVKVVLD